MKVVVNIPVAQDERWKTWRKVLVGVDVSKTNGFAFTGEFVPAGRKVELSVGSYLLLYDEVGSARYHYPDVKVCRVETDRVLVEVLKASGASWALDLRDEVAKLFEVEAPELTLEETNLVEALKALTPERLTLVLKNLK